MVTLGACATRTVDENDPESLYKDAELDIESSIYEPAIEKMRTVKNKFPYSRFAALAQLRIADAYFLMDNSYLEAASTYELFADLYPKHEKVPYARFRMAESYFREIPSTVARDLAVAEKALSSFQDFVQRFPKDELAKEGQARIQSIRNTLAEKELYIAEYYIHQDKNKAAIARLKKLVERYPDASVIEEAKKKLARLKQEISEESENP